MQNVNDAAYKAAIEAGQRVPLKELEVDWTGTNTFSGAGYTDLSDNIESMKISRALAGDLPDETGVVEGFVSSKLDATLVGTRPGSAQPLGKELNRWNADGVRYGQPLVAPNVRAKLGLYTTDGPKLTPKFTGYGRKLNFDEPEGTIELEAVDPSELLRALITLPTYGEFVNHAHRRKWKLTVNTQYILDFILRKNGIYSSPPFRSDARIACTGHGGLVANIGFNGAPISIYGDGPRTGLWTVDSNPWGMLGTPEGYGMGTAAYQEFYGSPGMEFRSGFGCGLAAWLHVGSYMGLGSGENRLFQIRPTGLEDPRLFINGFGNGDIYAGLVYNGNIYGTPRIATGAAKWKFGGFHFRFTSNTNLQVSVRLNGTTRVYNITIPAVSVPAAPRDGSYLPMTQVNSQCWRSWMLMQWWPGVTAPTDASWIATEAAAHQSQADVSRGLNEILAIPEVSNRDSWEVMKEVVSAEFGNHGFDENGRYSFRVRSDVRADKIDVDLDVDTNLLGASYTEDADSARNVVGYKTLARYHTAKLEAVVTAQDINEFICYPGTSYFVLPWPHGAAGYQSGVLPYKYQEGADTAARDAPYFGKWGSDVMHGWTYSSIGASGGWTIIDNTRSVVVRYQQITSRLVQIRVDNPGPGPVRLATGAEVGKVESGEAAMKIGGWPLTVEYPYVDEVRDQASITRYKHERSLPLDDNQWRQDPAPIKPLAKAILDALKDGAVMLEDLPVIGNPNVQAGDVARCWFRDITEPLIGTVIKADDEVEESGYDMSLSVRLLPVAVDSGGGDTGNPAPAGTLFYLDISRYQNADDGSALDLQRVKTIGYAGIVAKIGQGGSETAGYGQTLDPSWATWRDQSMALFGPRLTAGYWYIGDTETPASQAARCKAAIGNTAIPVMMDWETGGGNFANLVACINAFRAEGLKVTMVYAGRGYANANSTSSDSLAGRGVSLISARYWTNEAGNPRDLYDAQPPGFGLEPFLGVTPVANQFTQYGRVYSNPDELVDVNSFLGTTTQLGAMFHGE